MGLVAAGGHSGRSRTAGRYELLARATDATGAVQPVDQPWNTQGMANNMTQRVTVFVSDDDRGGVPSKGCIRRHVSQRGLIPSHQANPARDRLSG